MMNAKPAPDVFMPHIDLLRQFDVPAPRYTSYPTADRFVQAFTNKDYIHALATRKVSPRQRPLSIYIHLPFCESLCYYCACNKIITKHHEKSASYLLWLTRELELQLEHLGTGQNVSHIHLGGGSPSFFSDHELAALLLLLRKHFNLLAEAEISIELDPRNVNTDRLVRLHAMGFTRVSFGIQDFDPAVQKAVHRVQSTDKIAELFVKTRELGFASTNADMIYGLPKQTMTSFDKSLDYLCWMRPDRVALYAYAHLPERFKAQRRIHADDLPISTERTKLLRLAIDRLLQEGYHYIGMDHFALPNDALAIAKRQGRLHRNFQGYTTQSDTDLLALGVSAIGQMGLCYSQNVKTLDEYTDWLSHGQLPIDRGLQLSRDDVLRRAVIMTIMCQGFVDFASIEQEHFIEFKTYFAEELVQLEKFHAQGLVEITVHNLAVTPSGWYVIRAIAKVFDRYLQAQQNLARFSKIM